MGFIGLLIFIKTKKKKNSHRWSQIKISEYKQILDSWVDRGTPH